MTRESKLYALVLGKVIARLREHRGLRQGELADQAGVAQSTWSRTEKGQGQVDAFELRNVARVLRIEQATLLRLTDEAFRRTERAARQMLKGLGTSWWDEAEKRVGRDGAEALITFAVCATLSEEKRAA